jgi:hypothetical protein
MTEDEILKINPNTADEKALQELPGIGRSLAKRIVDARPFADIDDIQKIPGIGSAALDRIKPYLVFDAPPALEEVSSSEEEMAIGSPHADEPLIEVKQPTISSDGRTEETFAELGELKKALEEAPSIAEKPEKAVISARETKGRKSFSRWQTIWLVLAAGVFTFVFSLLVNLALLAGINGTLNFNRLSAVRQLENNLIMLEGDLEDLSASIEALDQRLTPLEGLTGRMVTVEGQMEALLGDVGDALATVELMQSDLDQLSEETARLSGRVDRFDTFIDGLRQLLAELFVEPSIGTAP